MLGAMPKSDEIDRSLLSTFAWRVALPVEEEAAPEEPAPRAAPPSAPARAAVDYEALRERAHRRAAVLADDVDRIWSLPEAERAPEVSTLLAGAGAMGALITGMQHYPEARLRLFRLALQHWDELEDETQTATGAALLWSDLTRPEMIDFITDAARQSPSFSRYLLIALSIDREAEEAIKRSTYAGACFARLLTNAETHDEREIAVAWIRVSPHPDAILPLRRALTLPVHHLRWVALSALDTCFPDAIAPEDVRALVEDTIAHAPPVTRDDERSRVHRRFPRLVERLILKLRPEGIVPALSHIVRGDCDQEPIPRASFDETWALRVLAALSPADALPLCDELAHNLEQWKRSIAVEGAARLPDELAWPRLAAAAADPAPDVSLHAQHVWLQRRGTPCPVDELAGVQLELLDAPPSDVLRSRVALLRTGPHEARTAMVEVLLAEAPRAEALVCLLFGAADPSLCEWRSRPGVPRSRIELGRVLVDRFGAPAVRGLATLALRYDDGFVGGYVDFMGTLLRDGVAIPAEAWPVLHAVAVRHFVDLPPRPTATGDPSDTPLVIFGHTGAPRELAPRLAALTWGPRPPSAWSPGAGLSSRRAAAKALAATARGDAEIDAMILDAMRAARADGDVVRFSYAAAPAAYRGLAATASEIAAVLGEQGALPEGDPVVADALHELLALYGDAGGATSDWLAQAITEPGTQGFVIAARVARWNKISREIILRLAKGLEGPPIGAVESAIALIGAGSVKPNDPALAKVIAPAPLYMRAEFLTCLMTGDADVRPYWPTIEEILLSRDARVVRAFQMAAYRLADKGLDAEARAIAPRMTDPNFRALFGVWEPEEHPPFWMDPGQGSADSSPTPSFDAAERDAALADMMQRLDASK